MANQYDGRTTEEELVEGEERAEAHPNRDPITGESGAHPVGAGIGATAVGAVGTAIGAVAGPVGAVVGAAIGGVVGGLVGSRAAEAVNPTIEDDYWREQYNSRPYAKAERSYEDYQPAYRTAYEAYPRYHKQNKTYDEVETELQQDYETNHPQANLNWEEAKYAARDAWDRVESNFRFRDEDAYWREHYTARPYYQSGLSYEDYQPAYRAGYEGFMRYRATGRSYEELEPQLQRDYQQQYGATGLNWQQAKYAVRDAWQHLERSLTR